MLPIACGNTVAFIFGEMLIAGCDGAHSGMFARSQGSQVGTTSTTARLPSGFPALQEKAATIFIKAIRGDRAMVVTCS